jgi:ATP-dependent Lhr-like helicase
LDERVKFHPAVHEWFHATFGEPTSVQAHGWPAIQSGHNALLAAPTGSGKTLAAFLCAIDALVQLGVQGALADETHILYVSPLKALSNDVQKNLELPLAGIRAALAAHGAPDVEIRSGVRTGDTAQKERARMTKKPPHILVTTPESLYILLTSEGGRRALKTVRTVIVDEIHALAPNKRGAHLALSLERLEALCERRLVRIGLSATQKPIEAVASFLVGARTKKSGGSDCVIVDEGHVRARDLKIEIPRSPIESVQSGETWEETYDRLAELIREHRTTLIFVNTRKQAERIAFNLSARIGKADVTSHHGSLSREHRFDAEQRLKAGKLRALVATSSLELGIDIGDVDLVCQIGSTRTIATLLQRVGRAKHQVGGVPKGRIFPTSRDELVEAAALCDAVARGELDKLEVPVGANDILAQQIVAASAAQKEWSEADLFALVRRAWPYRDLTREAFDSIVAMLADGFVTARGRRGAHLHHDAVNQMIRPRRGARLVAITSGGAIPDVADYDVILEPADIRVGSLNEDFAIESNAGDIFQLGNVSYRIRRVERGKVRVEDARGAAPTMPFWLGEAPSRSFELSGAVSRLRQNVADDLAFGTPAAIARLVRDVGVPEAAAVQIVDYLRLVKETLGVMPTQECLVIERFFDESGGMHLVLHAPFGSRVNRAWGLALRKCFCRKFDFELQAAANEDALLLSLGPAHSFAVDEVWSYLRSGTVRALLVQALLDAPMFATRWRWNAGRALAILRFRGGKKVAPQLQRMEAEDLLAQCFPDQVACQENLVGDREIPHHPLVTQTIGDCLTEAMDIEALERILRLVEASVGSDAPPLRLVARDVTEPSPLAAEILNARPYAFLDDAPLEERRTQAVMSRRWLDPNAASDIGALDAAAITAVCEEAWPEPRDADEMHDALAVLGFVTEAEARVGQWGPLLDALASSGRATKMDVASGVWASAERLPELRAVHAGGSFAPAITAPGRFAARVWSREEALVELVRSRLQGLGPTTVAAVAASLAIDESDASIALAALEAEGFCFRGSFRGAAAGDATGVEYCERRLLARIHRRTLDRLRREIEPVALADFLRFLTRWQRLEDPAEGATGLSHVLRILEGFEAPASAWEHDLLAARTKGYDPSWLDTLCLSGRIAWARISPPPGGGRATASVRQSPIALVSRDALDVWLGVARPVEATPPEMSADASRVLGHLRDRGAAFFSDLLRGTGLLRAQLELALGELVWRGLLTADSFAGLRALVVVPKKTSGRRRVRPQLGIEAAGRWSTIATHGSADGDTDATEAIARTLLRRWGVVARKIIEREGALPPWRELLVVYRRLEARGEIRGGRFVTGLTGEQYALPEAIATLREVRRAPKTGRFFAISAADPLNVVGLLTPGARVTAIRKNRIVFRDGILIAAREGGETRFFEEVANGDRATVESLLVRDSVALRNQIEAAPRVAMQRGTAIAVGHTRRA